MNALQFWQQKLVQTLHDPIHKQIVMGTGLAHAKEAVKLARVIVGKELRSWNAAPDRLATGADRPLLGSFRLCKVDWCKHPLITHPLQPGIRMRVPSDGLPVGPGARTRAAEILNQLEAWWAQRFGPDEGGD